MRHKWNISTKKDLKYRRGTAPRRMKCVLVAPVQTALDLPNTHLGTHLSGLPLSLPGKASQQTTCSLHMLGPWPGMPANLLPLSLCPGPLLHEASLHCSLISAFPTPHSCSSNCPVFKNLLLKSRDQNGQPCSESSPWWMLSLLCSISLLPNCSVPPSRAPASQSHASREAQLRPSCDFLVLYLLSFSIMFQIGPCREFGKHCLLYPFFKIIKALLLPHHSTSSSQLHLIPRFLFCTNIWLPFCRCPSWVLVACPNLIWGLPWPSLPVPVFSPESCSYSTHLTSSHLHSLAGATLLSALFLETMFTSPILTSLWTRSAWNGAFCLGLFLLLVLKSCFQVVEDSWKGDPVSLLNTRRITPSLLSQIFHKDN